MKLLLEAISSLMAREFASAEPARKTTITKARAVDLIYLSITRFVSHLDPSDTHGYTFFATEETLKENPEVIEKFLRAIIRATKYSNKHPEEAIQSVLNRDKTLNYDIELAKLKQYNKVAIEPKNLPIGHIDTEILEETYDRLEEESVLESSFDLEDAYTTEILENAHRK